MAGAVFLKLRDLFTGSETERRFRLEEKVEEALTERKNMEFLYSDAEGFHFMDSSSYEQIAIPRAIIGHLERFLTLNMKIPVEFYEGKAVNLVFPETVVLKVVTTGKGIKGDSDTVWKPAVLENNMEIQVPPFIKEGDLIKIEVASLRYKERASGT